jgi:hypothetical protein
MHSRHTHLFNLRVHVSNDIHGTPSTVRRAIPLCSPLPSSLLFHGQRRLHLQRFQRAASLSLDGSVSILDGDTLWLIADNNNVMGHAFVFQIVTIGNWSGGDGLAFVVVLSKVLPGASLESCLSLHAEDTVGNVSSHLFIVEFDTKQLSGGFLNETDDNHVGVDLNNVVSTMLVESVAYFATDDGRRVSMPL